MKFVWQPKRKFANMIVAMKDEVAGLLFLKATASYISTAARRIFLANRLKFSAQA